MPRISGVDIPADKPIRISLRYIYGIGPTNADQILKELNIDGQRRAKELSEEDLAAKTGSSQTIATSRSCSSSGAPTATTTA